METIIQAFYIRNELRVAFNVLRTCMGKADPSPAFDAAVLVLGDTLRLFGWEVGTLSLGNPDELPEERCVAVSVTKRTGLPSCVTCVEVSLQPLTVSTSDDLVGTEDVRILDITCDYSDGKRVEYFLWLHGDDAHETLDSCRLDGDTVPLDRLLTVAGGNPAVTLMHKSITTLFDTHKTTDV